MREELAARLAPAVEPAFADRVDVEEAARMLGISVESVRRRGRSGVLSVRIDQVTGRLVYDRVQVAAQVQGREVGRETAEIWRAASKRARQRALERLGRKYRKELRGFYAEELRNEEAALATGGLNTSNVQEGHQP